MSDFYCCDDLFSIRLFLQSAILISYYILFYEPKRAAFTLVPSLYEQKITILITDSMNFDPFNAKFYPSHTTTISSNERENLTDEILSYQCFQLPSYMSLDWSRYILGENSILRMVLSEPEAIIISCDNFNYSLQFSKCSAIK